MKKQIKIVCIFLMIVLLCLPFFTYASEIDTPVTTSENDEETSITTDGEDNSDSIIYSDLYIAKDTDYEMKDLVDGNVYILANGNVKISGRVNGNIYVLANGTVELTEDAYIVSSLYSCSRNLKVSGKVYDIYAVVLDKTELNDSAIIYRDIKVSSTDAKLRGTIYRNVFLMSNNIDVKDENSQLTLGGNFIYSSIKEAEGLSDVVKYGEINFTKEEEEVEVVETLADKITGYAKSGIMSIIYVLAIYGILVLIAPKYKERMGKDIKEKGIVDFAIGLLSWIIGMIILIMSIIIVFTIGAPISILVWTAMFVIIYISNAVFSIAIFENVKSKLKGKKATEIVALAGIALVVWILQQIPFVGGIVSFITVTTGVGLTVRNVIKKEIKIDKVEVIENSENTDAQ